MKYIEFVKDGEKDTQVVMFSNKINHDVMFNCVNRMKDQMGPGWRRSSYSVVSAGFVSESLECHGKSETLRVSSRPEATMVLREQLNEYHYG